MLGGEKQSYSIRDIANQLNLPKPTVHRILKTLSHFGYVTQDQISREYRLGFRLVELGQAVLSQIDLRKASEPYLHKLAEQVQETAHLVVLDDHEILYLDKVESMNHPTGLRMASRIGMRNYAHSCAVGKVLLAFLSKAERREIYSQKGLPKLTENTIADVKKLEKHLELVRARGYAADDEENERGIRCVAAPVRNSRGEVVAGISISGPAVRLAMERINKEIKEEVVKTALDVSGRLGFKGYSLGKGVIRSHK